MKNGRRIFAVCDSLKKKSDGRKRYAGMKETRPGDAVAGANNKMINKIKVEA
jgi:hypothetical protein